MKRRLVSTIFALLSMSMLMGADGAWLDRISTKDHARLNPLLHDPTHQQQAVRAGAQLFHTECAKCHGEDGRGLHSRPAVISTRIALASDGDLFWLMQNGVPWKGMPPWMMLPETERWQLVTYLRSLNEPEALHLESDSLPLTKQGVSR